MSVFVARHPLEPALLGGMKPSTIDEPDHVTEQRIGDTDDEPTLAPDVIRSRRSTRRLSRLATIRLEDPDLADAIVRGEIDVDEAWFRSRKQRSSGHRARYEDPAHLVLQVVEDARDADVIISNRIPRSRELCRSGRGDLLHVHHTMAERLAGKFCGSLRCRFNCHSIAGSERPGRRRNGSGPDWTAEFFEGQRSCVLDMVEFNGAMSAREIADALHIHPRRAQQLVVTAVTHLGDRGVDISAMEALLADEANEDRTRA